MDSVFRTLLGTMRLPFLLLTPACVGLGFAAAAWSGHEVSPLRAALVMLGAVAAHASVNMLNEWADYRSGLDAMTHRTAFSGGSGALPANPRAVHAVLVGGLAALALTALIGLWLLRVAGQALLPLGIVGMALVLAYTPWITRQPLACLLAPGVGFGPLMTAGAAVAVAGTQVPSAYVASMVPLALASGLLLLNQFPDVEADHAVGRRHLPMLWGRPRAARVFTALLALAYASIVVGVVLHLLPRGVGLGLLSAPLAWAVARDARRHADDLAALPAVMGRNVVLVLTTPVLMAAGGLVWH